MNKHDTSAFIGLTPPARSIAGRADESPLAILGSIAAAARHRGLPLSIWVALCLAMAGWYLHVTPSSYTAAATIILDPKRTANAGDVGSPLTSPPALDTAQAESQIQVIRSERLLSTVFDALDLANSPELRPGPPGLKAKFMESLARLAGQGRDAGSDNNSDLAAAYNNFVDRVGARRIGQSYVVEVSYTSGDPTVARRLANAVVSAYLAQQVSFKLAGAQNGAEYLQGRLNALGDEVKAANAGMLAGTVPGALLPDADARVIGAALEPLGRSAPRPSLAIAFALTAGLLSGLFAVAVASGLDRRIRTPEQLEETGLPCLGTLPGAGRRKTFAKRTGKEAYALVRQDPGGRFAAAIRDARTSVLLALGSKQCHAIGLVSWSRGSGHSLIAANLAQVVAMSGSPVTLVDADIHRLHGGLTDLVPATEVGLAEILLDAATPAGLEVAFDHNITLIPARSPARTGLHEAYLGSPRMRHLIEDWRQHGDVLVDLPALDGSGDARAAAALLDGVILIVDGGRTTTDEVTRAVALLSRSGAVVLGAILNKANA